jgi:hypothetical protein
VIGRYLSLDGITVEVNVEGEIKSLDVRTLPAGEASSDPLASDVAQQPGQVPVDTPLAAPLELCAAAPAPTKKQRTLKGLVRAMWTAVFSFGGEALVYGLNNLTALNLPPGMGLAIGAVGYGAKAAIFPNTRL